MQRGAEHRELEVKWQGWPLSDATWERQSALIEDGHSLMVYEYLRSNKLAVPGGLAAVAERPIFVFQDFFLDFFRGVWVFSSC